MVVEIAAWPNVSVQTMYDLQTAGICWAVSGDATVRAGTVVKRALPPFYLLQRPLRAVAGGWLQRSPAPAALYCGHGPMDACRCTVQA